MFNFFPSFCNHLSSVFVNNPSNAILCWISAIVLHLFSYFIFLYFVCSGNFRTCDILRMHAMCHIKDSHSFSLHTMHTNTHKHTNKHTHTHTQTHGRCQLCCLLSPGLVHTRIPPAGSTPHCSQSTTWRQLCALSLSLSPALLFVT